MHRMAISNVFLCGLGGLGVEIGKDCASRKKLHLRLKISLGFSCLPNFYKKPEGL